MSIDRSDTYIISLIQELRKQPNETEWLEFKHNNDNKETIGEYISALSNSAALNGKINAYMIWGVDDKTHQILGTTFQPSKATKGNEALENWLLRLLSPKIDFKFYEVTIEGQHLVLLEIAPAIVNPVSFQGVEYIRFSSYKKKLKELPERERAMWRVFDKIPFEKQIAVDSINDSEVLGYLEYTKYFELLGLPLPENRGAILTALLSDDLIQKSQNGQWSITNLGAILFAKDLDKFTHLKRKAIRVIQYKDNTKRELVANAIIHQDFAQTGNSVMIEIFANRFEVTNLGEPLVDTDRFLDSPPKSREVGTKAREYIPKWARG